MPEADKSQELKDFQDRLIKEPFYWYDCKDVTDLESQFVLGLLKFERQLLGKVKPSIIDEESTNERNADVRFNEYMLDEKKQAQRRKEIHKDIEDLLQHTKTVMANEDETIAARIFKVIELYKKADQWAAATAYDKEKYSDLLFDYAGFLYDYGLYKDAEAIYLRQIAIAEELYGKEHEAADPYFILKDFKAYDEARRRMREAYADRPAWVKMAMKQVAHVGMFSSDRTILEYINDIWHVDKLDPIEGEEER